MSVYRKQGLSMFFNNKPSASGVSPLGRWGTEVPQTPWLPDLEKILRAQGRRHREVYGVRRTPLLRYVSHRGCNAIYIVHLRGSYYRRGTAGYSWRQKLCNSHSALALGNSASCTVCYLSLKKATHTHH